ncbi:MAG: FapA family protein [Desulfobulbus sp.]|nr:FapA family protein [Desulfobulbus sp.]
MSSTAYFLHISPDQLQASLSCEAGHSADIPLRSDQSFFDQLSAAHIVHGLNQDLLKQAEVARVNGRKLETPLLIAQGTAPRMGQKGLHPLHTPFPLHVTSLNQDGSEESKETLIFPLVQNGEVLADHGPASHPETGKNIYGQEVSCPFPPEQNIVAGDHTALDEPGEHLLATATGYPLLYTTRKAGIEHLHLGIEPLIQVTPDKMQALLNLKPAPSGHLLPDAETIEHELETMQISYGRLPRAIEQCLDHCGQQQQPQTQTIALGILPIKGRDAWLRFAMDIGPMPGKVMGNGEIDYRERNMFIGVNKDQVIAVRVPPTPGSPGTDVFGNTITQTTGKDITVRVTDDASYDPGSGEIRALRSGVLSLVSEGAVKVCSRQVISQDIDFKTGNIVSRDALEIRGSIKPKFRVNALGDILIRGNIEKAQVRSDANVVVQTGLIGEYAVVRCRGQVDIQFVERGRIFAGGSILLRKSAYYCRLHSGGNLTSPPGARILASQLVAADSMVLGSIGSDNAEPSLLAAAVSPEQLHKMYALIRDIAVRKEVLETLRRRLGPEAESEEFEELQQEYEDSRKAFNRLNLITANADADAASDQGLSHALECTIVVKGTIFAGSEIRIGNSSMILPSTMHNVCFRLREHIAPGAVNRDILILPNKK